MIEFLCTMAGLLAGVAITASLLSSRYDLAHLDLENRLDRMETEKMHGVAMQLQVLSQRVFSDVNAHTSKVEIFNTAINEATQEEPKQLLSAIDEILIANKAMQSQLADAQKRIAEQSQIIEKTTHQARTDTLTGLANRRALDETLTLCLENSSENHLIGLLLLDIDKFKSFNDTYGHLTGDGVLKCFARSIAQICGTQAFPARYGGEEFAVILTGDTPERLAEHAAVIRQFASQQKIYHEDLELTITASAGLSVVHKGEDLQCAYERSDEGLYKAKENGRNRGYWLSDGNWQIFPTPPEESLQPSAVQELREDLVPSPVGQMSDTETYTSDEQDGSLAYSERGPVDSTPDDSSLNFLELSVFFERVSEHLGHLQRSGLPASCFMVEPLPEGNQTFPEEVWELTSKIVGRKMRGIDLICVFRPLTACVFLPGCSSDSVMEKASDLLLELNHDMENWNCEVKPKNFAIAAGHSLDKEDAASFLDRIEKALDEAYDASPTEIVVHGGQSTYFRQV